MASGADKEESMILRTVYLPKEVDNSLKSTALNLGRKKSEVIRECVRVMLLNHPHELPAALSNSGEDT